MPGLDRAPYLTSVTMMDVDFLPEHLLIVGGSYVGLEFAQMYRRFGSRVTIVEMSPRVIAREDEDVSQALQEILASEDIALRLNAKCLAAEPEGSGVAITMACESGAPRISGSHLLLAVGRVPNTDDLGLGKAGVQTDQNGYIVVDDELRTSVPGRVGAGRLQRTRRLHPYQLQRLRDRRGQSIERRWPAKSPTGSSPTPCSPIRRLAASD